MCFSLFGFCFSTPSPTELFFHQGDIVRWMILYRIGPDDSMGKEQEILLRYVFAATLALADQVVATRSISTRAPRGKAATATVERAGLESPKYSA